MCNPVNKLKLLTTKQKQKNRNEKMKEIIKNYGLDEKKWDDNE